MLRSIATKQVKRAGSGDVSAGRERMLNLQAEALMGKRLTGPSSLLNVPRNFKKLKLAEASKLQLQNYKAFPVAQLSCDYYHSPLAAFGKNQVAAAVEAGIYLFDLSKGTNSAIRVNDRYGIAISPTALCLTENQSHFVIGTASGSVELWDIEEERPSWTRLRPYQATVRVVAAAQGLIYTVQDDGYVDLWDPRQPRPLQSADLSAEGPCGLSLSPDRGHLALGLANGTVSVFKMGKTPDLSAPYFTTQVSQASAVKVHRWVSEKTLLLGCGQNDPQLAVVRLREDGSDSCIVETMQTHSQVRFIGVSPGKEALFTAHRDGSFKFWRWDSAAERLELEPRLCEQHQKIKFMHGAQSEAGQLLTVSSEAQGSVVRLWEVKEKPKSKPWLSGGIR